MEIELRKNQDEYLFIIREVEGMVKYHQERDTWRPHGWEMFARAYQGATVGTWAWEETTWLEILLTTGLSRDECITTIESIVGQQIRHRQKLANILGKDPTGRSDIIGDGQYATLAQVKILTEDKKLYDAEFPGNTRQNSEPY